MPGEQEVDRLLEIHARCVCILGRVVDIVPTVRPDRGCLVVLAGLDSEGFNRVVVVQPKDRCMFRDFVLGRRVGIVCRPLERDGYDWIAYFEFTHLGSVADLSRTEAELLWPWRNNAMDVLTEPGISLTARERDLCTDLAAYGRPPSARQRRFFESIVAKPRRRPTPETVFRSRRFTPREARDVEPIGVALLRSLEELRRAIEG